MNQTVVLHTSSDSDTRVLSVSGDIDLGNSGEFAAALLDAVTGHQHLVVIDLSGVTFFGVSGLSVLIDVNDLAHATGRTFVLDACSPSVRRVLDLTGTQTRFRCATYAAT
jgi:anti-sigma B factor antagonist